MGGAHYFVLRQGVRGYLEHPCILPRKAPMFTLSQPATDSAHQL